MLYRLLLVVLVFTGLTGCDTPTQSVTNLTDVASKEDLVEKNGERIETERLSAIVKVLASDEFEGRAPGTPENLPENGLFFRADHFSLAQRGVPVLLIMGIAGGADLLKGGRKAGDQWIADYIGSCYHQTCDAWSPDWDLRGAAEDIELFRTIVEDLGNSTHWPKWKDGSEFKMIREVSADARK